MKKNKNTYKSNNETLEEFKNSFFYGSRNNLFFKYLGGDNISENEFTIFIEELLNVIVDDIDKDEFSEMKKLIFNSQIKGYLPKSKNDKYTYENTPWTEFSKPLKKSKLSLISAGGVFCKDDDPIQPRGMTQENAINKISEFLKSPPILAEIPNNISKEKLSIRHPGYDIRAAEKDPNVVFPYEILKNLHQEGVFASYTNNFYSFVGASQQSAIIKTYAPKWAQMLKSHNVDAVLLVAA
jgi:glycine/betaine/sarcosine/D-proline reductase family selenoprotein B|tara:strand:- start:1354 stop:2070 length:717 start_codon:yes stop_codon:yes gene_type:complete